MVALITGASKGIGRSLAELLVNNGWEVYGVSRSDPQLEIQNFHWLEFDLMNFESYQDLVGMIPESIDLLVNNAGISYTVDAQNILQLDVEKQFKINTEAPILLMTALLNKLSQGKIINISSIFSKQPHNSLAIYSATKAALNEFSRGFSLDTNIPVYLILPSMVDSPVSRTIYGESMDKDTLLQPSEVAQAVVEVLNGTYDTGDQIVLAKQNEELELGSLEPKLKLIKI